MLAIAELCHGSMIQSSSSEIAQDNLASQVSGNHRLDDSKAEQDRIKTEGFEVSSSNLEGRPCGPLRVWPGGLAMGRSLGDYEVHLLSLSGHYF